MSDKNVMGAVNPQVVTTMEGSSKKKIAISTGQSQRKLKLARSGKEELTATYKWPS